MENAKLMEIIQQKIAADDADPGWAVALIGLKMVEKLEAIEYRLKVIGIIAKEFLRFSGHRGILEGTEWE
jgi:hypothetical protein